MKKILPIIIAVAGLLVASASSQAQTIVWGSAQNMVGDSDVQNVGTYFDAITFGSNVTVNGVVFQAFGTTTNIMVTGYAAGANAGNFTSAPPSSANYSAAFSNSVYGNSASDISTVTITGLTIGDAYSVQAWSYFGGSLGGSEFIGANTVDLNNTAGQFATGTFTATSNTETFQFGVGAGNANGYSFLSGVSVFDVTGSTPEPSTVALFAMAITGLGFQLGRKRRLA